MNWHSKPLVSYRTVVNLIGGTRSGLKVKGLLDMRDYEAGQEVSSRQIGELHLRGHVFDPDWNSNLLPSRPWRNRCKIG